MFKTDYEALSARLKALAHPERLFILDALRHGSKCVCQLEALLDKPQPYVSQQLRLLREAGLICDKKQGQNVFYSICNSEVIRWLDAVLGPIGDEHALDEPAIACASLK
ncbi:MAG: ArsR/SmtB family transcription factor [Roseiflexus sp.]